MKVFTNVHIDKKKTNKNLPLGCRAQEVEWPSSNWKVAPPEGFPGQDTEHLITPDEQVGHPAASITRM